MGDALGWLLVHPGPAPVPMGEQFGAPQLSIEAALRCHKDTHVREFCDQLVWRQIREIRCCRERPDLRPLVITKRVAGTARGAAASVLAFWGSTPSLHGTCCEPKLLTCLDKAGSRSHRFID
jgi:hypothetical protein